MIISTACERELPEFRELMKKTDVALNTDAKKREDYYSTRGGKKLEEDVYRILCKCAQGTPFDGSVELISGASFPDIVARRMFGVEVKSTEKDHWQSIGSSILESTRDQNVERIYMTFGKLGKPVKFISKPYEDCLSDIVVTHYPRYKIDMQLQEKEELTIFEKMKVEYDELRKMDNPVPVVSKYYKSILKDGQSLWWAADDSENEAAPMTAKLWTSLSPEEKEQLTVEGYALFPEVLSSSSNKKYNRYALWLATQKGIINTNIRDSFSAGGQVEMPTNAGILIKMPAAFGRIAKYKDYIRKTILEADEKILEEYWQESVSRNRIQQWCDLVAGCAAGGVGYNTAQSVLSCIFPQYNYSQEAVAIAAEEKTEYDK